MPRVPYVLTLYQGIVIVVRRPCITPGAAAPPPARVHFFVDRSRDTCHTPSNNADVARASRFGQDLSQWMRLVKRVRATPAPAPAPAHAVVRAAPCLCLLTWDLSCLLLPV
jgi:hypothetical protein